MCVCEIVCMSGAEGLGMEKLRYQGSQWRKDELDPCPRRGSAEGLAPGDAGQYCFESSLLTSAPCLHVVIHHHP